MPMSTSTTRRQNASCDPCRRSKRRCVFGADRMGMNRRSCDNCFSLGHKCTSEFSTTKRSQRRRPRPSLRKASVQNKEGSRASPSYNEPQGLDAEVSRKAHCTLDGWYTPPEKEALAADSYLVETFFRAFDPGLSDFGLSSSLGVTQYMLASSEASTPSPKVFNRTPNEVHGDVLGVDAVPVVTLTQSLNASFAYKNMTQWLATVNNQMITATTSTYLHYYCNHLAGKSFYDLEGESADIIFSRQAGLQVCERTPLDSRVPNEMGKVNLLGAARLLDKFSVFYDKRAGSTDRKLDEKVLAAVLQAFALQWLPSDGAIEPEMSDWIHHFGKASSQGHKGEQASLASTSLFLQAWFNARDLLLKVRSERSFVLIYANFLFDMIIVPTDLSHNDRGQINQKLDHSLKDLGELEQLVRESCDWLVDSSFYAPLLQSSITLFHWFAYVRDTVAAFMSERECVMKDADLEGLEFPPDILVTNNRTAFKSVCDVDHNPFYESLALSPDTEPGVFENDQNIPTLCRKAASAVFNMWRLVLRLRSLLKTSELDGTERSSDCSAIFRMLDAAIQDFDLKYDPSLKGYLESSEEISAKSTMDCAFVVMFWNLGLLTVAREIHCALSSDVSLDSQQLSLHQRRYKSVGVASITLVASCIVNLPRTSLQDSLYKPVNHLPFATHHANISLVVSVLVQAIEAALALRAEVDFVVDDVAELSEGTLFQVEWSCAVETMLKCLISMKPIVSGAHLVSDSLKKLLRQYGDTLLDCWVS